VRRRLPLIRSKVMFVSYFSLGPMWCVSCQSGGAKWPLPASDFAESSRIASNTNSRTDWRFSFLFCFQFWTREAHDWFRQHLERILAHGSGLLGGLVSAQRGEHKSTTDGSTRVLLMQSSLRKKTGANHGYFVEREKSFELS
jgi:hypothetical protein